MSIQRPFLSILAAITLFCLSLGFSFAQEPDVDTMKVTCQNWPMYFGLRMNALKSEAEAIKKIVGIENEEAFQNFVNELVETSPEMADIRELGKALEESLKTLLQKPCTSETSIEFKTIIDAVHAVVREALEKIRPLAEDFSAKQQTQQ